MSTLGYDQFSVVGHDRGARSAYRVALDDPGVVTRLAVLDIVPTADAFRRADMDFSLLFWVWSFLAAPEPVPEQLIAQAHAAIVNHMLDSWSEVPDTFPAEVRAEYIDKFSAPNTVHAICVGRCPDASLSGEGRPHSAGAYLLPVALSWRRGQRSGRHSWVSCTTISAPRTARPSQS